MCSYILISIKLQYFMVLDSLYEFKQSTFMKRQTQRKIGNFFTKSARQEATSSIVEPEITPSPTTSSVKASTKSQTETSDACIPSTESQTTHFYPVDKNGRCFLPKWISTYPWIIWDSELNAVLCKTCQLQFTRGGLSSTKAEAAFTRTGFKSWKKVPQSYKQHEASEAHRLAVFNETNIAKGENICSRLHEANKLERKNNTQQLCTIFECLKFLGRQGMSIRGDVDRSSNLKQLLNLICKTSNNDKLQSWLQRKTTWTGHDMQNSILSQISTSIQRQLASTIKSSSFFGLMADETSDISGDEQMSIGFRIVNDQLQCDELIIGLYQMPKCDSETIFQVLKDVL